MKKGFTLIELLGVIVILGVLALIATVSVESIISGSKTDLSKIQKQKLEEAAEAFYITEGMNDGASCVNVSQLINKGYLEGETVKDLETDKEMPGSVKITNSSGKYSYKYQKNSCEACQYTTDSENDEMVTCGTENFYVMYTDENSKKVTLLAEQNLSISTSPYLQAKDWDFNPISFSTSAYWSDGGYTPAGDSEYAYVYDSNSNLYKYVESYKNALKGMGVDVIEARLMSYEEAKKLKCEKIDSQCASRRWVYYTSYWLGSTLYNYDILYIDSYGYLSYEGYNYVDDDGYGIRPVITISKDIIKSL